MRILLKSCSTMPKMKEFLTLLKRIEVYQVRSRKLKYFLKFLNICCFISEIKTERSFFEEALEIINARQSLLKNYQESSEQTVPKDEFGKREKIEEAYDFRSEQNENLSQSEMRPSSAKSSILGESTQFYSEEKLNRSKLPPLTIKSVENYDLSREETRMSSASSISVSNTNSTQFPKINSRYLPK